MPWSGGVMSGSPAGEVAAAAAVAAAAGGVAAAFGEASRLRRCASASIVMARLLPGAFFFVLVTPRGIGAWR